MQSQWKTDLFETLPIFILNDTGTATIKIQIQLYGLHDGASWHLITYDCKIHLGKLLNIYSVLHMALIPRTILLRFS